MDYQVIDNFLDEESFLKIKNTLYDPMFPWYFNEHKTSNESDQLYDLQFTHDFYGFHQPLSNYYEIVRPLINLINPVSIIRIKSNLTTYTKESVTFDYHIDVDIPSYTMVYYVNTNNGCTKFKNGESVMSVENRALIFNSQTLHAATTSTNTKSRCVINMNFIN